MKIARHGIRSLLRMKKIYGFLTAVMVCTFLLFNTTETKAQDGATASAQRDDDDDNDGMDYGWIGLIGLAGLIGLRKRDRDTDHTIHTTNNPSRV